MIYMTELQIFHSCIGKQTFFKFPRIELFLGANQRSIKLICVNTCFVHRSIIARTLQRIRRAVIRNFQRYFPFRAFLHTFSIFTVFISKIFEFNTLYQRNSHKFRQKYMFTRSKIYSFFPNFSFVINKGIFRNWRDILALTNISNMRS